MIISPRHAWEDTKTKTFLKPGVEITLVSHHGLVGESCTALDIHHDYSGEAGLSDYGEIGEYVSSSWETYPVFIDKESGKLFIYDGTGI